MGVPGVLRANLSLPTLPLPQVEDFQGHRETRGALCWQTGTRDGSEEGQAAQGQASAFSPDSASTCWGLAGGGHGP